ncbi:unnamed protein product [Urochloa humidicola]
MNKGDPIKQHRARFFPPRTPAEPHTSFDFGRVASLHGRRGLSAGSGCLSLCPRGPRRDPDSGGCGLWRPARRKGTDEEEKGTRSDRQRKCDLCQGCRRTSLIDLIT